MSKKAKHLPTPPNRTFGSRKKFGEDEEKTELIADRMAMAAAEGRLDEFLKKEMPDNEYARSLANMMMGMTGIIPGASEPVPQAQESMGAEPADATDVPEEVRKAIEGGNVRGLMEMLRREHKRRSPESEASGAKAAESAPDKADGTPAIDKKLIDDLVQIAQDNSVSLDWIILRAIKVYVQEYRKNGKL